MRTKILLLFAIFFCAVFASNAQINTGRYFIGGGFNMLNAKNVQASTDLKNEFLNSNIQFGKVVKKNKVVGLILSYGYSKNYFTAFPDSNFNKRDHYSAGAFYRKYKRLAKDFYIFGEADAVYSHSKYTQDYFQNQGFKSISNGGVVSFNPGISYALWKRMQVELLVPDIISLSYSHVKTDYYSDTPPVSPSEKGNVFSVNTNLNSNLLSSFGIGFKFILGK